MLVDDGQFQRARRPVDVAGTCRVAIPATIQAVLTARLDRLQPEERRDPARSVIGRVFWWGAVCELATDAMRPGSATLSRSFARGWCDPTARRYGQDAFRFTHILIRDAAYRAIPKSVRADLHERLAGWIEDRTQDSRASTRRSSATTSSRLTALARARSASAERDGSAGARARPPRSALRMRAFARGDMRAAVNLLSRAARCCPADD